MLWLLRPMIMQYQHTCLTPDILGNTLVRFLDKLNTGLKGGVKKGKTAV